MKKVYTLILAISVVSFVFGQTKQMRPIANSDLNISKPFLSKDVAATKNVNATLNENFDIVTFPPASWSLAGDPSSWFNSADAAVSSQEPYGNPSGHFALFDVWDLAAGSTGSLITPVLHPTAGSNTLTYKVNVFELNAAYASTGAQLFIEFSTDGGTTWTTSTTNVLAALPNFNVSSTDWQTLTADLSAYNGGAVKVRFRGISDYGGFSVGLDDVTGPEADITLPLVTDIVVTAVPQNAVTPLEHAMFAFSATVTNLGADLNTATNLDITCTPGGYSDAVAITMPLAFGTTETVSSSNYFVPTATGDYTVTYSATVAGDANPADNSSANTFNVSDSTFAADDDVAVGGIGNSTPITFGNLYYVLANDNITSLSVGFGNVTADENFTMSLYTVDPGTGVATVVYTTPTLVRTAAMANLVTTFKIPDVAVTPGLYFCAVSQTGTVNISVAYDGGGDIYILGTGNALGVNSSFGEPFIRMNNGLITNVKPVTVGKINVYPNPSTGNLSIVNAPNSTVEVYNLVGELVFSQSNVMSNVDLSSLVNGSYIVKITTNNGVYNEKINIVR